MSVSEVQNADGSLSFIENAASRELLRLRPDQGAYLGLATFSRFTDDFMGDVLDSRWSGAVGSDGAAVTPTINQQNGGVVRLTSGAAGDTMAHDGSSLTHGLNWKAGNGGLYFEARVKPVTSVANVCYNIGLTDTLATTTLEMPITLSTTTLTTNATDAAVFVFDTAATLVKFKAQGVKADTDTALADTAIAPVADTWIKLAIIIDNQGTAYFYINDALTNTVASCLTTTVALTPVIAITARTTTSKSLDVDYVRMAQIRV